MNKDFVDMTLSLPVDDESLEDNALEDFEVTLRMNSSTPPEKSCGLDVDNLPEIAITPTSAQAETVSLDEHSTISLNSSTVSPYHKHSAGVRKSSNDQGEILRTGSPVPPDTEVEARDFFAYRDSILSNVVAEVTEKVNTEVDGNIKGTWLLTEIDSWNHEWERVVVLCDKVLIIIKYDFIGMKIEDTRKVSLSVVDKVIQGELTYPQNSLTPKINGLAEGIAGVVKDCIIPSVHGTVQTVGCAMWRKNRCANPNYEQGVEVTEDNGKKSSQHSLSDEVAKEEVAVDGETKTIRGSIMSALSLEKFESKNNRKSQGIQIIWDENQPLSFHRKWNPFDKTIPIVIFTSHPLYWYKGGTGSVEFFDIETFCREFLLVLGQGDDDLSPCCRIEYKPIIIESYVGIASLLHNANSLGFYKVRGKVSF